MFQFHIFASHEPGKYSQPNFLLCFPGEGEVSLHLESQAELRFMASKEIFFVRLFFEFIKSKAMKVSYKL